MEGGEEGSRGSEGVSSAGVTASLHPPQTLQGQKPSPRGETGWSSWESLLVSEWKCEPCHSSKGKHDLGKVAAVKQAGLRPSSVSLLAQCQTQERSRGPGRPRGDGARPSQLSLPLGRVAVLTASLTIVILPSPPIAGRLLPLTRFPEILRSRGPQKSHGQLPL